MKKEKNKILLNGDWELGIGHWAEGRVHRRGIFPLLPYLPHLPTLLQVQVQVQLL